MSTVATIGENIRKSRAERDITLAMLSCRLELDGHPIGIATLSKIERGDRPTLSVVSLMAIAEALDTTVGCLINESPECFAHANRIGRLERALLGISLTVQDSL